MSDASALHLTRIGRKIDGLFSYFRVSQEVWQKQEQVLDTKRRGCIDVLRNTYVEYNGLTDYDVCSKISEREYLRSEMWDLDLEVFPLEKEEYALSWCMDEIEDFHDNKTFFYASLVMMCYSCIERHLTEICMHVHSKDGPQFNDKKAGTGIFGAYEFLELAMDYKINNADWIELNLIRRLRNNLVHLGFEVGLHDGGDYEKLLTDGVSKPDQSLIEYLAKWNAVSSFSIRLNDEYCQHLVSFTEDLFENIINDLCSKKPDLSLYI